MKAERGTRLRPWRIAVRFREWSAGIAAGLVLAAAAGTSAAAPDGPAGRRPDGTAAHVTAARRRAAVMWIAHVRDSAAFHALIVALQSRRDYDATLPCPWSPLIVRTFPDDAQWAVATAWRESRCQPDAANPSSSARGLFQLLQSYHAWRYLAVGCGPGDWADAHCAVAAARHLYNDAGRRPWAT